MRVMKATARSQVWKDDAIDNTAEADVEVDAGDSDDDMQVIGGSLPKRRAADDDSVVPSQVPQTDDDWLRSKTTKTLNDEAEAMDLDDQHSKPRSDAQDPPQVENTAKEENTPEEEKNTTEEEKILKHRRLYVRNLPFDVLEDDLRDHFSAFGELEEVRLSSLHTPFRDEP